MEQNVRVRYYENDLDLVVNYSPGTPSTWDYPGDSAEVEIEEIHYKDQDVTTLIEAFATYHDMEYLRILALEKLEG